MREYVKKQLLALELAIPSTYEQQTNTYFIPKYNKPVYRKGSCYVVKLSENYKNEILSYGNFTVPSSRLLKISVRNVLGKLIEVDALEVNEVSLMDTQTFWFGRLNRDFIELVQAL